MDRFGPDESPVREYSDEGAYDDNLDRNETEYRSKERNKGKSRGDEKDHRSKDRRDSEKDRKERRREDRDERDKERSKEKPRDRDKDRKEKEPERDREIEKERGKDKSRDRETEKERGKDKSRDREKERDKTRDKERERGREKHKDREKERESEKDRERDKAREKSREKGREMELDKERSRERERDRVSRKAHEEDCTRSNDNMPKLDNEDNMNRDINKHGKVSYDDIDDQDNEDAHVSTSGLGDRILKMKEERLKKNSEGASEILSWVNRSRKIEQIKNVEKKKALQLSKIFEEQDNIVQGESEDEEAGQHNSHDLAGVKVLHGLDKVMEGGAVVLTLKDQQILADGDINEDVDMLENIEIGEQKRRDEAYKAAKKKTGIYDDKFNDDPSSEKKILPQYDEPATDEGLTLDARGLFTGEAEKKLEELRRRIQGVQANNSTEDLKLSAKITSDYFTQDEMLQFKKPKKKKKSIRKKEKLDLDALETEALSAGLGVEDLGSRKDGRRQAIREEQEKSEAEMKNKAYQSAYAKAEEAIKSLRMEQTRPVKLEENEEPIADDEDDLYKSLERARKLALKKQEASSGPEAIARLATSQTANEQSTTNEESEEKKVVITELQEFVWGLPVGEEVQKQDRQDVFMDEDEGPRTSDHEMKDEPGGWTEVKETGEEENPSKEDKEEIVPDETIHELAVGKGLAGALSLLKDRGTLKEGIDWGGRNMDKKKSKLIGVVDDNPNVDNRFKDIRIERTDEFGRIMTPKEAFRMISHKFHGKGPGKMKQEKRMKQYQEELKLKQMKNSDTPTESVERMREAQARLKTPYLVLSGHVKPGQTSDPRSGFATVEKDLPAGGLTPMLGNRKVEHFLGIKRKGDSENTNSPKNPRT